MRLPWSKRGIPSGFRWLTAVSVRSLGAMELHLSNPGAWTFLNGPREETRQGELQPPNVGGLEHVVVPHERKYRDFTATFRFFMRALFAGIVKADGSPLQRYLHFGIVRGVCPETERHVGMRPIGHIASRFRGPNNLPVD